MNTYIMFLKCVQVLLCMILLDINPFKNTTEFIASFCHYVSSKIIGYQQYNTVRYCEVKRKPSFAVAKALSAALTCSLSSANSSGLQYSDYRTELPLALHSASNVSSSWWLFLSDTLGRGVRVERAELAPLLSSGMLTTELC